MSEKKLTKSQQDRINDIIKQWERDIVEQVETLPEPDGKTLDGSRTRKRMKLEQKYKPMIQAIMEEADGQTQ